MVAGDSIAHDLGNGLARALGALPQVTVINQGRAISGLVREDFLNWQTELPRLLDQQPVDAVVISIGMNDRQNITEGGRILQRFTPDWETAYQARASRLMQTVTGRGLPLVWMGMPTARARTFHNDMAAINTIFTRAAAQDPAVSLVPMWDLTSDATGNYIETQLDAAGRSRRLRADDGMHLSVYGVQVVSGAIVAELSRRLGVSLAP